MNIFGASQEMLKGATDPSGVFLPTGTVVVHCDGMKA